MTRPLIRALKFAHTLADPNNFRAANNQLLGAWQGVMTHAHLWSEVEELLKSPKVEELEEELTQTVGARAGALSTARRAAEQRQREREEEGVEDNEGARERVRAMVRGQAAVVRELWAAVSPGVEGK
eukprot:205982-Rhodomonas_salina.1